MANFNVYAVRRQRQDPRTRLHGVVFQKTTVVIKFTDSKASHLYKESEMGEVFSMHEEFQKLMLDFSWKPRRAGIVLCASLYMGRYY